jgi:hypothetical protein
VPSLSLPEQWTSFLTNSEKDVSNFISYQTYQCCCHKSPQAILLCCPIPQAQQYQSSKILLHSAEVCVVQRLWPIQIWRTRRGSRLWS